MAARLSISDDWEDVGDDNLSVVSLPTSDQDEATSGVGAVSDSRQHVQTGSSPSPSFPTGDSMSETTTLHGNDDAQSHFKNMSSSGAVVVNEPDKSYGGSRQVTRVEPPEPAAPVEAPFWNPPTSQCLNLEQESPLQGGADGNRESNNLNSSSQLNPSHLLQILSSLGNILNDTIQSINDLTVLDPETSRRALILCKAVVDQVMELSPIVSGYAKVWSGISEDIPLDPGLHNWLSGVRCNALGLQVELQEEARRTSQKEDGKNIGVDLMLEELHDWKRQMDDFLPIMQVDFNEFQTSQMTIPVAHMRHQDIVVNSQSRSAPIDIPQPAAQGTGRSNHAPVRPSNDLWMLRRELYHLKDDIQRAIENLSEISRHLKQSAQDLATDVSQQYGALFNTITLMLSNHGSDWIDHGLSGGLTFAQFVQLDGECIRDFATQLEQQLNGLSNDRRRLCALSGLETESVQRETMHLSEGRLEQLEVLAQVLTATLCNGA